MSGKSDVYKTIRKPSQEILLKEKKSKFYGYAFPIVEEEQVKPIIEALRRKHPSAGHICYAWQLGMENPIYRANDDGEPNNSAGKPIYGQIQSFGVTNVLVAISRVFGGTKLGVGGLMTAYRTAAQMTLEVSEIIERTLQEKFRLSFSYPAMNSVMRVIKQRNLTILSQKPEMDCELTISVRRRDTKAIEKIFDGILGVEIKKVT